MLTPELQVNDIIDNTTYYAEDVEQIAAEVEMWYRNDGELTPEKQAVINRLSDGFIDNTELEDHLGITLTITFPPAA